MNEIQKHLVKMLQEIDEICVKNDIPYLLCGRNAKDACQCNQFLGEYVYASIMMRGQDFAKFRALVAEKEGRAVESILNNPDFPAGMSMRYVDETTTFIYGHLSHNFKYKGIYITIQNCRNVPRNKYKQKVVNTIDELIAYAGNGDKTVFTKKTQRWCRLMDISSKIFGKLFVVRRLVKQYEKLTAANSKNMAYVRPMKDNITIPATMFTSVKRVKLEDSEFLVPTAHESYLEKVYGKSWKTDTKTEDISSRHLLVASAQVSYKDVDVDNSLYANRGKVNRIIQTRADLSAQIKKLRDKIEEYWVLLFMTKERYRLYRKYMPIAHLLHQHLVDRDYAWLTIAMQDYMTVVKTYLAKGLPITICPELDEVALEMLYYSGDLIGAQQFKELKETVVLNVIDLPLNEAATEEALAALPATISYDEENAIPTFLRCGEELHAVVRLDDEGVAHPLLLKSASKIVLAPMNETDEEGEIISEWQIALETEDGVYAPFFACDCVRELFETQRVLPLVQNIYNQDLELAWLAEDGRIYIAGGFGACDKYQEVSIPTYCAVLEDGEVPVSFFDEDSGVLRPLFCRSESGERLSVITLGAAGSLWVTPNAADNLYYLDDEGQDVQLTVSRFADEAAEDVKELLDQEKQPELCCKLVQEDAFGRVMEIAALYDDESIQPLARMTATGTLSKITPQKATYATLTLTQKGGSTIPLAIVDAEGNVTSVLPESQKIPFGSIVGNPLG